MWIFRIVLLLVLAVTLFGQQTNPSAPASIEGVVVGAISDEPLVGATVQLRGNLGPVLESSTDSGGKFLLPNVSPGSYRIIATNAGYVRTEYSQRKVDPVGSTITITPGQHLTGLRIGMTQAGVITGRVIDRGISLASVAVVAVKVSYDSGQRMWTKVLSGATDDQGEYHIFWLPPGRYYVMADLTDFPRLPPPTLLINPFGGDNPLLTRGINNLAAMQRSCSQCGRPELLFSTSKRFGDVSDAEMHAAMFYPNTPDWQSATAIDVGPGAEIHNVDIHADPIPALHVRGTVNGLPAAPGTPQPQISLYPLSSAVTYATVSLDPNGTFDIPRVRAGTYILRSTVKNLTGSVSVEVRNQDVSTDLTLVPGLSVLGRIVVEGQSPGTPVTGLGNLRIALAMEGVDLFSANTAPANDATFTLGPLQSGDYRVFVRPLLAPPGTSQGVVPPALENAFVKSIQLGDIDVLTQGLRLTEQPRGPLVITIGTNAAALEGRVVNGQQQPSAATTVVLIPESSLRFHISHKYTSTDASGRFQMSGIPPGEYKLFAWESVEPGAWQDPEFMSKYESSGKPIHIAEDSKASVELTSIPR